jgi:hypothetical protein
MLDNPTSQSNVAAVVGDHLARGKHYLAKGDEFYRKAADEFIAAMDIDPDLTEREIGRRMDIAHTTVSQLVEWRRSGADRTTSPFGGEQERNARLGRSMRQAIREQPETVVDEVLNHPDLVRRIIHGAETRGIKGGGTRVWSEAKRARRKRAETPVLWPGACVELGDHWLICDDACIDFDLASARATPGLIISDPPYGIEHPGIANDHIVDWRKAWGHASYACDSAFIFCWSRKATEVAASLASAGFTLVEHVIWNKGVTRQRSRVRYRHENILYCERLGDQARSKWIKGQTLDSPLHHVLSDEEREQASDHPAVKPVALLVELIKAASKPGDTIYDPFLGSGSTLIACELTGRHCYALEIEPVWCDRAVHRWQALTGRDAIVWCDAGKPLTFTALERDPSLGGFPKREGL